MSTFQDIVRAYNAYDLDGDGVMEISLLQHLWLRNPSFDQPSDQVYSGGKLVVVIVESRLFDDLGGSRYTVDDLYQRLLAFKSDLNREGRQAKFLEMKPYSGPNRQDGKTLLAMREFFKAIHDSFGNFEGAILIGSFPEASIVRNWPQWCPDNNEYRVGLTPGQPRPFEIVLADLDGNWRNLYRDSVNLEGYVFHIAPSTSVSTSGSKVTLTNPTITKTTASLQDVFWIQDAAYRITQPPGGPTTVELDLTCIDPEISALDRSMPNPVARPDICISRINARSIAVQPPSPRLLDANGKPQETPNNPPIDFYSMEAWSRDPKLERTLLIDYLDRNHAFRSGKFPRQKFGVSLIECGLGTVAADEGLDGLNYPRPRNEVLNATLLDFTRWLKNHAVFRVVATHADCHATILRQDDPDAVLNAALVETECGGHPWRWIEENGKYVPSFKGHYTGDLYLYRTLWENGQWRDHSPSFLMHLGCDVDSVAYGHLPYDNSSYGTFQNAASLLFYANQLAVLCRVTWWNRGPMGFGAAFGASASTVLGDGWKAVFEHLSQDSVLARQSTERKQSYIWNLIGDWTLQKYYPAPNGTGIDVDGMVAIDPLALVLRDDIYTKLHLPDPAPPDVLQEYIRQSMKEMTPEEKKRAVARVKVLSAYVKALEKALR
jgi:hypothetical protein